METETLAMAQEIDFSMLALFARATLTVKFVMILLIVMSFLVVGHHRPQAPPLPAGPARGGDL